MCKIIEDMRNEERRQGIKEGMKQGIKEGSRERGKDVTLRMLKAGKYALEEIAEISGLSLEEVKSLEQH